MRGSDAAVPKRCRKSSHMGPQSSQKQGDGDSPVSRALVHNVIGAFFAVYNELRFGFLEAVYCTALANEFRDRGIGFLKEPAIEVVCKGRPVGLYRPDFLVESQLVIEAKATHAIGSADARQLLNCLRATNYELGYLLHFGPEARFIRVISSHSRRKK